MDAVYLRSDWERINKEHISRLTMFENTQNTFSALSGLKAEFKKRSLKLFQSFESLFPPNTCLLVAIAVFSLKY